MPHGNGKVARIEQHYGVIWLASPNFNRLLSRWALSHSPDFCRVRGLGPFTRQIAKRMGHAHRLGGSEQYIPASGHK